jgi:hypothetical protein
MNELENLLNQLSAITKGYRVISRNSKNDYNIFKILNLQSDEVNLHSLFLSELLNPKGSHNKGNEFLELFLTNVLGDSKCMLEINKVNVKVEKFIGPISADKSTGGRIDIIIEDGSKNCLVIENKIYAGDQEKQLLRYHNYCKNKKSSNLFYLTLIGKEPDEISSCHLKSGDHFNLLSYKIDIVNWLEKCHQISSDSPFIRETIQQYIYLIKSLTGQTINKEMYQDIKNTVLNSPQNIESAYHVVKEFENIKIDLLIPFWQEVKDQLAEVLDDNYEINFHIDLKANKNYPAIFINEKKYYDLWYSHFAIEPLNGKSPWNPNKLYFGIWVNSSREPVKKQLNKLQSLFGQKTRNSNWWLDVNDMDGLNFSGIETLKRILPNTPSRLAMKDRIVEEFKEYILENKKLMESIIKTVDKKA